MFELESIKVVFADFDDTICVHLRSLYDDKQSLDWRKAMYTGDVSWYLNKELFAVQEDVKTFLLLCVARGIVVNALSCSDSNIVYLAKLNFLDTNLPSVCDNLYITTNRESKLDLVKHWCEVYNVSLNEVLVVDDHPDTQHDMRNSGIHSVSPITIITMLQKGGEQW